MTVAICFLFSYLNPGHERRAREICERVAKELAGDTDFPFFEIRPVMREQSAAHSY